jgi:predicted  nucleic acid-binding Zn-ribbon protein
MSNNPEQIIRELSERFNDDEQVVVLLATLSAALAEMEVKLASAERKMDVISGSTADSLQRLGGTLGQLRQDIEASDEELADLHKQVNNKLSIAAQLDAQAQTAMADVLVTYQTFNGDLSQLKEGVAGLTKAVISSVLPEGSSLIRSINSQIDEVLGLSGGGEPSPNVPDGG